MLKRLLIGLLMGLATVGGFAALAIGTVTSLMWMTEHLGPWWAAGIWGALLSVLFGLLFAFGQIKIVEGGK